LYWPGMSVDIDNVVTKCKLCQKYMNANAKEYLKCHEIPDLPFNKIGLDIAEYGGKIFLIVIDYYSKWPECLEMKSKTTTAVIRELKRVFSVHGIPAKVIGDNNPFGSYEFKQFALDWNFEVVNSSPLYPRSNGQVEKTVQTMKRLIKKCSEDNKDVEIALLELRNTPVVGDKSPSQLLMSRRLRSKVPVSASLLRPQICERNVINKMLEEKQTKAAMYHDRSSRPRRTFNISDEVNVYNVRYRVWEPGKIVGYAATPSSYYVKLYHNGSVLQRNTFHLRLRPMQERSSNVVSNRPKPNCFTSMNFHGSSSPVRPLVNKTPSPHKPVSPRTNRASICQQPNLPIDGNKTPSPNSPAKSPNPRPNESETPVRLGQATTRFGRVVRKPEWLVDYC